MSSIIKSPFDYRLKVNRFLPLDNKKKNEPINFSIYSFRDLDEQESQDLGLKDRVRGVEDERNELLKKARRELEEAQLKARGIIEEATQRSDEIRRRSKEQGFEEGYGEGIKEGTSKGIERFREDSEPILESLTKTLSKIQQLHEETSNSAEKGLVNIGFTMARKVIHNELNANPESVAGIVRAALEKVIDSEHITIKVNPEDLELVKAHRSEFIAQLEGLKQISLEPDNSLGRGDSVVDTDFGEIDARVLRQIEEIEKETRKTLES